jgi:hypothetical protein
MRNTLVLAWAFLFPVTLSSAALPGGGTSFEKRLTVLAASEDDYKPDTDPTLSLDPLETGTQGVFPGVESEGDNWRNVIPESDPDTPSDDLERIEE